MVGVHNILKTRIINEFKYLNIIALNSSNHGHLSIIIYLLHKHTKSVKKKDRYLLENCVMFQCYYIGSYFCKC